jgi:hypothetical protein
VILKNNKREPEDIDDLEPRLKVQVSTKGKPKGEIVKRVDPEREIERLRAKVEELENRIAELEKKMKTKP